MTFVDRIISGLIPPIFLRFMGFRKLKQSLPSYETFDKALLACQSSNYENSELVKLVIEKNINFKNAINNDHEFDLGAIRTIIPLGLCKDGSRLNVLDFGGGGGYHYTIAKKILGDEVLLRWAVVETPAMVRESGSMENNELRFFDNLESAKIYLDKIDLVFTSSTLQYCPDPLAALGKLIDLDATFLYITRTVFGNTDQYFFSKQISNLSDNGPGEMPSSYHDKKIAYPITFCSLNKVEKMLLRKYDIKFRVLEERDFYKINGNIINSYGFFSKKRT